MRYADPEAQAEIDRLRAKVARVEAYIQHLDAAAAHPARTLGQQWRAGELRELAGTLTALIADDEDRP